MPESTDRTANGTREGDGSRAPAHRSDAGGANLTRVRAHNERLVLSVLRDGPHSRADVARETGLSAQTISLIVRALDADGLIRSGSPVRGRVGQPSVPLTLAPKGAYFAGLQIGRRGAELALIDFTGDVVARVDIRYRWSDPDAILRFVDAEWSALTKGVPRSRLHGLGIAMPFEPWEWPERLGGPASVGRRWREVDLVGRIGERVRVPVHVENDATAACGAELTFGEGRRYRDFAYVFVAHFVGGGIVLDRAVHGGRGGNAAAFGSLPVPDPERPGGSMQLIDAASLHALESSLTASGRPGTSAGKAASIRLARSPLWTRHADLVERWERRTADALAIAAASIASVVEIEALVIDGIFPAPVRASLCERTRRALDGVDTRGVRAPAIVAGSIGPGARTLGAARLPLFVRFLLDQGVLTRTAAD